MAAQSCSRHARRDMEIKSSKGKEIKIPGPDHPITISPVEGKVRVTVAGRIIADSPRALRLEGQGYPAVYYLPRDDADTRHRDCKIELPRRRTKHRQGQSG